MDSGREKGREGGEGGRESIIRSVRREGGSGGKRCSAGDAKQSKQSSAQPEKKRKTTVVKYIKSETVEIELIPDGKKEETINYSSSSSFLLFFFFFFFSFFFRPVGLDEKKGASAMDIATTSHPRP